MALVTGDTLRSLLARASALPDDDQERWRMLDEIVRAPDDVLAALPELVAAAHAPSERAALADVVGRLAEARRDALPDGVSRSVLAWLEPAAPPRVLTAVLAAARRLATHEGTSAVLQLAGHPDSDVRIQAALTLGTLRSQSAVHALATLATDSCKQVREWAVEALASLPAGDFDEAVLAALRARVDDADEVVRCGALTGLARRGDRDALIAVLRECDPDGEIVGLAASCNADREMHDALVALRARGWLGDQERLLAAIRATRA